jgi:hypothetical protein
VLDDQPDVVSLLVANDSRLMQRFWIASSPFCSRRIATAGRRIAVSLGKMPTTSARRLISPFRRSSWLIGSDHQATWAPG